MKVKTLVAALAFSAACGAAFAQAPGSGLRAADANGDGNITRAEFDAANTARFERMDADHDGQLTQTERTPPQGALQGGPPPGAGQGFNPDANNDGVVSRAEFDAASAQRFARMDQNGDGAIGAAEASAPR